MARSQSRGAAIDFGARTRSSPPRYRGNRNRSIRIAMWSQLFAGALISFLNFGIHALMTGVIVLLTRRTAARTDHLHVFMRLTALLTVTMIALMCAHVCEIGVWAVYYELAGIAPRTATPFEFAFENYTA